MGDWMMNFCLKLDALTFTMILAPACCVSLLSGVVSSFTSETVTEFLLWWSHLIPRVPESARLIPRQGVCGFHVQSRWTGQGRRRRSGECCVVVTDGCVAAVHGVRRELVRPR